MNAVRPLGIGPRAALALLFLGAAAGCGQDPVEPAGARPSATLELRPAGAAPAWSPADRALDLARFEVKRGEARLVPEGLEFDGQSGLALVAEGLDFTSMARIAIEFAADEPIELDVSLSAHTPAGVQTISLAPGTGGSGTKALRGQVVLRLPPPLRRPIERVRIAIEPLEVERVRLLGIVAAADVPPAWREFLEGADSEAALLPIGLELRRGWVLAPGAELAVRCTPAPGAVLGFAHAFTSGADPTAELAVDALPIGRGAEPARLATLSPSGGPAAWRDVRAELGELADREIELRFRWTAAGPWPVAIAEPSWFVPDPDPPTVLLVTSDTHRADHVEGALRAVDVRTPAIASLAARGVQFVDALATSNITVPSHAALFTGRTPRETGVVDNRTVLAAHAPTLAEAFRGAGWLTCAAVSVNLLSEHHSGLGQGFARYSECEPRRSAAAAIADLERWLPSAEGRPLFCWLHIYDAHGPYEPAKELVAPYWPASRDPYDPALPDPAAEGDRVPAHLPGLRDLDYVRALYKGAVAGVDGDLAGLLAVPRFADGVVAFTADHGEGQGEHDIWWAHKELYPEMLAVPLVLAWPAAPRGERRAEPVRQIDVGRTLLDLAGLADLPFPGRSLATPAQGPPARTSVAGYGKSIALTYEGWHLIRYLEDQERGLAKELVRAGQTELYDLASDPGALVDQAASAPARKDEMQAELDRWLAETEADLFRGERHSDPETLAELARLGYVEGPEPAEEPAAEPADESATEPAAEPADEPYDE